MRNLLFFCALAILMVSTTANSVDGIAVTQAARWCDTYDYAKCPEMAFNSMTDDVQIPGKIVRAVISGSKVTSLDTIWKQSLAKFPVINMQGTIIAMYRYEARIVNGALVDANKPRHISVMDVNGQNMRDLVTITKPTSGGFNEGREFLDWTSDDWIYYSTPSAAQMSTPAKIYRVKATDSLTNQLVYTYFPNGEGHVDRWTLSSDGKRAVITATWQNYSYTNVVTEFPPLRSPTPKGFNGTYTGFGSCNGAISPSGKIVGSFIDGGHTTVYVNNVDPIDVTKLAGDRAGATCSQMSTWAGENVGQGMGYLRWSTNSEKWYCVMPAGCRNACCGGNQVLVNQYDHQAIMISHNQYYSAPPYGGATIVPFCTAGDFWVKGPAGTEGKCEDTLGNWIAIGGTEVVRAPAEVHAGTDRKLLRSWRMDRSGLTLATNGVLRIELLDANGRQIHSCVSLGHSISLPSASVPRGIILVRAISGISGKSETVRLSVE